MRQPPTTRPAKAGLNLRAAGLRDVALLKYWDTKPHVIAATGADSGANDWESDIVRDADWDEILISELGGRPVGYVRIIDPAAETSRYWGDVDTNLRAVDIWIGEEADLGRGFGAEMMRLAIQRCFSNAAVRSIIIDPLIQNTRARRFFERLGFQPVERRMFGDDDCLVSRLDRADWPAF